MLQARRLVNEHRMSSGNGRKVILSSRPMRLEECHEKARQRKNVHPQPQSTEEVINGVHR